LSNDLSPIGQRLPAVAYNDVMPKVKDDPAPELRIGIIVAVTARRCSTARAAWSAP
jgi:hypothetical protein